jgi:CRISPR/Cas system CSM-associated protein Csm3 (group 7 of RAMP superfamily)
MTITEPRMPAAVEGGREPRDRSASFLVFELRFTEPGGVTVPGEADEAQVMLDLDPAGRVHLPGTSLVGAIRELVRERRGAGTASDWFGPLLSGGEADAKASRVWVLGSSRLDDAPTRFLSSTRIDRARGAAAGSTLRTEEVLPAGARFEVFLRWDDARDGEVEDLAALIAAWRPLIGRGVSRGRGRCAVDAVRHGTLRLSDLGDLLRWLTLHGPELAREVAAETVTIPGEADVPEDVLFRVPARIAGPWRIGTGNKPESGSREPLRLLRAWPDGPPAVPGTAVKGLFRSRAEFILRSVAGESAACVAGTCGQCWTCEVFGYGGGTDADATAVGGRSAVRFADTVVDSPAEATRAHIAIDRFTGGVLDGALYTAESVESGMFTIEAALLPGAVGQARRAEIAAVLRLVLEDLNDGIIGMGAATARGYGTVRVDFGATTGELPDLAEARRTLAGMVRGGGDGAR